MATLADKPGYRKMTVEEFLDLPIEGRAELEDGVLYLMAGGSPLHAAVIANIIAALRVKLRGSGCRPMSSDMVVQTGPTTLRMPDASVYCNISTSDMQRRLPGDPTLVCEVLSPSTSKYDQEIKLHEYRSLAGLQAILLVNPEAERVRLVERTGPEAWTDRWLARGVDVPIGALGISLAAEDIFARD